ncbi:hypothetical protein DFH07DRAFT_784532 [Mycena maculata]|uniref:Uncharacterized protein n=1 Tax=Mycena maculata TaxID=230809 RepID=A0AAD7HGV3_9AGAR|nr:hypothetical protein DFH07DRAFT_784532 [Mycena maculata]
MACTLCLAACKATFIPAQGCYHPGAMVKDGLHTVPRGLQSHIGLGAMVKDGLHTPHSSRRKDATILVQWLNMAWKLRLAACKSAVPAIADAGARRYFDVEWCIDLR